MMRVFFIILGLFSFAIAVSTQEILQNIKILEKIKIKKFQEINVDYDPFFNSYKIIKKAKILHQNTTAPKKIASKLQLIAILNNKAFINRRWVGEKDKINGYRVVKITSNRVILKKGSIKKVLYLKKERKILTIREKR